MLSHVHILMVSKSNLKLQVFGLFSRFVCTLTIKISSSEEPASSTSIHRVRNGDKLVILFHPSPKILQKGVDRPVENPQKSAKNIKMTSNTPNNRRMRRRNAPGVMPRNMRTGLQTRHSRNTFVTNCQCYICSWILTPRLFKDHLWIFGFKDHSKDNEITFFKSFVLATSANKE